MRAIATTAFILISSSLLAQSILPKWGQDKLKNFTDRYVLATYIKPNFLEADFSGDKSVDLAILIERKTDKKKGILILLGGSDKSFIVGAGTKSGNGGEDFKWADEWRIYEDDTAYETTIKADGDVNGGKRIKLGRKAIAIREKEGSGGLIYFDGKKFVWIHQGD